MLVLLRRSSLFLKNHSTTSTTTIHIAHVQTHLIVFFFWWLYFSLLLVTFAYGHRMRPFAFIIRTHYPRILRSSSYSSLTKPLAVVDSRFFFHNNNNYERQRSTFQNNILTRYVSMGRGDEEEDEEFKATLREWKKREKAFIELEKQAKKEGIYNEMRKHFEQKRSTDDENEEYEDIEGEDEQTSTPDEQMELADAVADELQVYTDYEKAVRKLYTINMYNPVKLGLDNIQQLHAFMGRPMDRIPVVHVAGSNGKGSVSLKIAKTLQLSNPNLKVGLFTSPHISCFRERVQINGEPIPEEDAAVILPTIYDLCQEHDIPATFFEITTAMAFAYYAAEKVDIVVLEVGLGGRLDATNVIAAPALSIITSISLEHTRILGDTIEKIAMEKAGIIKENCPVLVGPHCPHDVIKSCAEEKKASHYYTCEDFLGSMEEVDDYDLENAGIAIAALKILQEKLPNLISPIPDDIIEEGVSHRPPCRFEYGALSGYEYILDVAHNPAAMEYLARKLKKTFPHKKFRVVVGMSSDKNIKLCMQHVYDIVDGDSSRIYLAEAEYPRAAKLAQILEETASLDMSKAKYKLEEPGVYDMIMLACEESHLSDDDELIVICGSIFIMSEARESLLINVPMDSPNIAQLAGAHLKASQEYFGNSTYPLPQDRD